MIKIYTDTSFIIPEYRKIIFPLLFDLCFLKTQDILEKYQIVEELEMANIVIVPVQISYFFKTNKVSWLYSFIDKANNCDKKVWVYTAGDFGITLKKDVYTFRLGGFHTKLDKKTFIMPAYAVDPYSLLNRTFKPISKFIYPEISFVGHAGNSIISELKEYLIYLKLNMNRFLKKDHSDYQPFFPSAKRRYHFLMKLKNDNRIITRFVLRNQYRAGAKTPEDRRKTTVEFFNNMFDSPYVFCLRGAGNFSVRFYEALAMGRIPLVINTDCRFPLPDLIQWEKHCIVASENNFIAELIRFHETVSESDFEQMQKNNRELWLSHLNRKAFFEKIYNNFKEG